MHKLASVLTPLIFNIPDHFTPEGPFLLNRTPLLISFPHISNLLPHSIFTGAQEKVRSFAAVAISSVSLPLWL